MDLTMLMELVQIFFLPLLAFLVYELRQMRESVQQLNTTVAAATERLNGFEARYEDDRDETRRRLERLEEQL